MLLSVRTVFSELRAPSGERLPPRHAPDRDVFRSLSFAVPQEPTVEKQKENGGGTNIGTSDKDTNMESDGNN